MDISQKNTPQETDEPFNEWVTNDRIGGFPIVHIALVIIIFILAILSYNEPSTHWVSFTRNISASMIGSILVIPFMI